MRNRPLSILLVCTLSLSLLTIAWAGLGESAAYAASFTVTKAADTNDGSCDVTDCSLREAIIAANATAELDTITLPAGNYSLTLTGPDDVAALGDLDITAPLVLTGAGAGQTIIDAGSLSDRVFEVHPSAGTVTLGGMDIAHGSLSAGNGGGIYCEDAILMLDATVLRNHDGGDNGGGGLYAFECSVTLSATQVTSNTADQGAGIYVFGGALTLTHSLVDQNTATGSGGGIFSWGTATQLRYSTLLENTTESSGGGLYQVGAPATLAIANSLIAENTAHKEGGGIFTAAGQWATAENSTISGNRANTYGGGINTRIPTTITHTTITNNVADDDGDNDGHGGGLFVYQGAALVQLQHTLIASNEDVTQPTYHDCFNLNGSITSQGYNLVGATGNCTFNDTGDITGQDPHLGPLQDNGGATWTHALLDNSPARNTGDPAFTPPPSYDQRGPGFARVADGRIDIGAFEAWVQVYLPLVTR